MINVQKGANIFANMKKFPTNFGHVLVWLVMLLVFGLDATNSVANAQLRRSFKMKNKALGAHLKGIISVAKICNVRIFKVLFEFKKSYFL